MMRIMQSFHTRARRRRNARVPVDIWRKPSGPTAPRSGNMSFSHCPARHPSRRMKCNSGRSQFLPLQSSNVYVYKFSQSGCRFISKSLAKNKAYSKAHLNIPRIFNGLVRTHTNRELVYPGCDAAESGAAPLAAAAMAAGRRVP
jgi:hypothetical protein